MKIKNWFILAGGSATRWQGYQGEKIFNKIPRPKAKPEPISPNWQKAIKGEL
jgi:hypothetical protein